MKDLLLNILLVWPAMGVMGYALLVQPFIEASQREKAEKSAAQEKTAKKQKRKKYLVKAYYRYN